MSIAGFLVATAVVVVLARGQTARWERGREAERLNRRLELRRRVSRGHLRRRSPVPHDVPPPGRSVHLPGWRRRSRPQAPTS